MKLFRCALVILLLAAAPLAHAKGLLILNTGNELFEVGPFPEAVIKDYPQIKEEGLFVASMCDRFGILWSDVFTWNCRLVGSDAKLASYTELPTEVQALVDAQYQASDAKRSFWNHYAFWSLIGLFGALIIVGALLPNRKEDAVLAEEAA